MTGIAFGAMNLNVFSAAIVKTMHVKCRGLAICTSTSGSTFGQVVLVPLFVVMEGKYGWRICFVALSITTATAAFSCYFLLQQPVTPQTDTEAAAEAEKEQKLGLARESRAGELGCVNGEYVVVSSSARQDADELQHEEMEAEVELSRSSTALKDLKHKGSE